MTASQKEASWYDWFPTRTPRDLVSREELLARLRERGIEISERTLTYWELKNVIPRPIRQRQAGAKGAARALYPLFAVDTIAKVRSLQDNGISLRAITSMMNSERPLIRPAESAVAAHQFVVESALREYAKLWEEAYGQKAAEISFALIGKNHTHLEEVRFEYRSE